MPRWIYSRRSRTARGETCFAKLLVADHNAYHLGQLVTVRRLLGAWE
jgi:hypothetical protein